MMNYNLINEKDQWKLDGICEKCRREKYCSKQCSARTRYGERLISGAINEKLHEKGLDVIFDKVMKY